LNIKIGTYLFQDIFYSQFIFATKERGSSHIHQEKKLTKMRRQKMAKVIFEQNISLNRLA
jgi:hypothetical protein